MGQQGVERALGKLLTDENFRDRFFADPEVTSWEAGFTLSRVELEALSRLSREALARFSECLDKRISRACLDPDRGSLVLLLTACACCVLTGIGIGTFVATLSRSATQAQLMLFFVNPRLMPLSGGFTPMEAMPS